MTRTIFRHYHLALIATLVVGVSSCSKVQSLSALNPGILLASNQKSVAVNFCADPPSQIPANLKMIIIQDHSGSNSQNYLMNQNGSGIPDVTTNQIVFGPDLATDPIGTTRYGIVSSPTGPQNVPGGLLDYLSNSIDNSANPTRFYSIIGFNNQALSYPTVGPTNNPTPVFTPNTSEFFHFVQNQAYAIYDQPTPGSSASPTPVPSAYASPAPLFSADSGATSYILALNSAYSLISRDIALAEASPTKTLSAYVIVFMSDGSPIDLDTLGTPNPPSTQFPNNGLAPADYVSLDATTCDQTTEYYFFREPNTAILEKVQSIVQLLSSHADVVSGINLYTIYYYYPGTNPNSPSCSAPTSCSSPASVTSFPCANVDTTGQSLLQQMASLGHGTFFNVAGGSNINYNLFIPETKLNQFALSDIFITNSSLLWWNDGLGPHHVSTVNGLPDDVAQKWGIPNPSVRDTIGDGISDFVKYKLYNGTTYPNIFSVPSYLLGGSPNLYYVSGSNPSDVYRGACSSFTYTAGAFNGFSYTYGPNNQILFSSTEHMNWYNSCLASGKSTSECALLVQNRGLNDCEKTLLNEGNSASLTTIPDANGDLIPDTLEFINSVPFQQGAQPASTLFNSGNIYSLYDEIKLSLPTQFSNSQLLNVQPSTYNYTVSTVNNQSCYKYSIPNFNTSGSPVPDTVRVDVVFKNEAYQNQYLYRSGLKAFPTGTNTLEINDWNNSVEQSNQTWSNWP